MQQKAYHGEEVVIMIRWKSKTYWKQREKSDAGHKTNRGKPKSDDFIRQEVHIYEIKTTKDPTA